MITTSSEETGMAAVPVRVSGGWDWFVRSRAAWWLIAALFLVPRALLILLDVTPTSDADWYFWQAGNLAAGKGYIGGTGAPTAFWPPGWPMALSLALRIGGASPVTAGLFNLAWAALAAVIVQDMARRLYPAPGTGRLAVLLLALYPNSALYVPLALTEVFYTTLLLEGCWLLVARPKLAGLVAAGLVFGFATLVKAQTLVVIPLVFGIALWREGDAMRRLVPMAARGALVLGVAALVVAPWTLRNHRELGVWVIVSSNGGYTLLTGNNDTARGGYTPEDPVVRALDARKAALGELAHDAEAKRLGAEWIKAHPARFAALMPRKFVKLWGPDGEGMWAYEMGSAAYAKAPLAFLALRAANQLWYLALLGLFALAAWRTVRLRIAAGERVIDWWVLPYAIAAYPTAICLVFSGQSRFHYPVMPFVCMAAAWWLADLAHRRFTAAT